MSVRWTRLVTYGETRNSYLKRKNHLGDLGLDLRILTWLLNKGGVNVFTE
jgi:hypothetical protein